MVKVFCSGSCRLLTTIQNGHGKIEPIHSMFTNFFGINFLGKLHNIKQHIQFIQWINDTIDIPPAILTSFLTSFSTLEGIEDKKLIPSKKETIKNALKGCEYYIFEICSLKLYEQNGYQVQFELTPDYTCTVQSDTDLYNDLKILRDLIPKEKKIIFQVHFRPNIIYNDSSKRIEKRDVIYDVINTFCTTNDNVYVYDPSIVLRADNSIFDGDTHFNHKGYETSFNYLYENYMKKSS
jgi:hypothetical protein